jgi:FkbM family methyltransferase
MTNRPMSPREIFRGARNILSDWRMSARFCANARSGARLCLDFFLSRFPGLLPHGYCERPHQVRFRDGVHICYRVNKGDLHSIREIWFEEAYRLPFDAPAGLLLDLGANIGMTSVWLARKYRFAQIIAVEPDPRNVALLRRNLALNKINSRIFEAAIGSREGTARFEFSEFSNVGSVSERGSEVRMISVNALSRELGVEQWGLIKIDIEGGEADLLSSSTDWLDHARAIIIELHPQVVDCNDVVRKIVSRGWKYLPASSVFPGNMDSFVRLPEKEVPQRVNET